MTTEIRDNGWNLPTKLWYAPIELRIWEGYRTIRANSLKDAVQYMNDNYTGEISDPMYGTLRVSYKECHNSDGNEYSFMVFKQIKSNK